MHHFHHHGLDLAYLDQGEGDPILLIHGFGSNKDVNWTGPGWIATLTRAGRRVIALDNRGHGASSKLYDAESYDPAAMADDAMALLDHLGIERADLMGYSMGGRIAACAAIAYPDKVRSLILGGIGIHLVEGAGLPATIADALLAPDLSRVTDPTGRAFRLFAEQTKSDREALAACIRGSRRTLSAEQVATIVAPTLIAVGTKDAVAGDPHRLAALIPTAQVFPIPDRDHMVAVGDKLFKQAVLQFLETRP